MPYVNLNRVKESDRNMPMSVMDGLFFAHTAVQFAALAISAHQEKWGFPSTHLYALSIELSFKSLALRSGASIEQCRKAGHDPEKMIKLIEQCGTVVSERLKTRLADKEWFHAFLFMSRYPAISELNSTLDKTIRRHLDYPEMIAEIMETDCRWPLSFERGTALEELRNPPSGMKTSEYREENE